MDPSRQLRGCKRWRSRKGCSHHGEFAGYPALLWDTTQAGSNTVIPVAWTGALPYSVDTFAKSLLILACKGEVLV